MDMWQKFFAIAWLAVALMHLFAALASPAGYADPVIAGSGGAQRIDLHDCGPREHHIPIDDLPPCRFCTTQLLRYALSPAQDPAASPMGQGASFRLPSRKERRPSVVFTPDTRSPPSA